MNCTKKSPLKYPPSKKVDTVDTYFGTAIADPYRWLENDTSAETKAWVTEQSTLTEDYLSKIPYRKTIKDYLTNAWNYERSGVPFKKGGYYFFFKNNGTQNQSVLYYQKNLGDPPKILLDPNTFSADGTTALSNYSVSKNAKFIAYGLSKAGSDWTEISILNIETGEKLTDEIKWVKFSSIAWLKDEGFYYSCYDEPKKGKEKSEKNEFHKIYFHKIGQVQKQDQLIYEDKNNPLRNFAAGLTEDERFLIIHVSESTSGNGILVKDLSKQKQSFSTIVDNFDSEYGIIDNIENELLVLTTHNAPNQRLVLINPENPNPENWKTIIPESSDLLESIDLCNNKIIAKYLKDVTNKLYVYSLSGKQEKEISLPSLGIVGNVQCEKNEKELFYSFTNYVTPNSIYQVNTETYSSTVFFQPKLPFTISEYECKQVFYSSKDGTKIPLFLTYKSGMKQNGNNPVFLYGYGGFNVSVTPSFGIDKLPFLENGGIYAVANIRGGGEYGEKWHKAGTLCNKQNVFDDFIYAAEYLIHENYTQKSKIAIHGRSNGGLLVGAVTTQRPDLFKVAIPAVGVLDMLRYQHFTIGWAWATDYGKSDNKEEFNCLLKYSPLHTIKKQEYPATLVVTADHDDRVVPAHSFKYTATLQENQQGNQPVLARIEVNAGHGSGKPTSKVIEEWADIWAFVFYNLEMPYTTK